MRVTPTHQLLTAVRIVQSGLVEPELGANAECGVQRGHVLEEEGVIVGVGCAEDEAG